MERTVRRKTAKPRRKPEPRTRLDVEARRAQLLELGLAHFGSRAYDDVSIDAIAEAAGISKGLLYHYFPTKKAFYAATVEKAAARLLDETETSPDLPPMESLLRGLEAYLDYVRAHGPAFAALMRSGVGMDPEIARIVDRTRAALLARLTDGFSDARAELPATPLFRIALRGWVGLAETASLAWVEALASRRDDVPRKETVRDLLASALLAIVRKASESL